MNNKGEKEKKAIVLNRMYVGDYLSTNLGHEVINMFQADNGGYYIYLNSRGNIASEHAGKIGMMLFVKYHTKGVVEVIGKAVGLEEADGISCSLSRNLNEVENDLLEEQMRYIKKQKGEVSYNKAKILDIFKGAGQQNIYITYKAGAVFRPKEGKHIFIRFSDAPIVSYNKAIDYEEIVLEGYKQAKASLKQYIYPCSANNDYEKLKNIITSDSYWEKTPVGKVKDEMGKMKEVLNVNRNISLFDICQLQDDENRFSNALAYFMTCNYYRDIWQDFFKQYNINLGPEYWVAREEDAKIEDTAWNHSRFPSGGRIDLLIRDKNNIIVIENKIKSDINTIAADKELKSELRKAEEITQLNRYVNYVEWCITPAKENSKSKGKLPIVKHDANKTPYYFILAPRYNQPENTMNGIYEIITYHKLYYFLKDYYYRFKNDVNFVAFFDAMYRHTHENVNDFLYYEMMEKFVRRIKEANGKK